MDRDEDVRIASVDPVDGKPWGYERRGVQGRSHRVDSFYETDASHCLNFIKNESEPLLDADHPGVNFARRLTRFRAALVPTPDMEALDDAGLLSKHMLLAGEIPVTGGELVEGDVEIDDSELHPLPDVPD